MARQSSRQGAPRFRIKPNLAVAFELRFWIIQGLERGPEEVQSFPAGENVPDLTRTKTCQAVPGRFFVRCFGSRVLPGKEAIPFMHLRSHLGCW